MTNMDSYEIDWLSQELAATRAALAEALALLGEDEEENVAGLDELHYLSENPGQREW